MSGAYATPSTGGGRLSHVAERFSQFYNDLEIEKNVCTRRLHSLISGCLFA